MIPIFESKDKNYKEVNYSNLVKGLISQYHSSGGTMRKTKTRLYFYDTYKQLSESITLFPELIK